MLCRGDRAPSRCLAGVARREVVEPVGDRLIIMEACVLCGARKFEAEFLALTLRQDARSWAASMSKGNVRQGVRR